MGELAARLWGHLPAMRLAALQQAVPWPRMTPQDIVDIASYLGVRAGADPYPSFSRGHALLVSSGCLRCHALAGEGGRVGPDLSRYENYENPSAWAAAMWNHGPKMLDRANQMGVPFPVLNRQEMVDLLGFLSGYTKTRP
jgi:cytochrome c